MCQISGLIAILFDNAWQYGMQMLNGINSHLIYICFYTVYNTYLNSISKALKKLYVDASIRFCYFRCNRIANCKHEYTHIYIQHAFLDYICRVAT